ncbi:hypothetical protein IEE94_06795 [Yimella sp. cx-573]|nr:hypothetical protein [Yimella sp. cx-573]
MINLTPPHRHAIVAEELKELPMPLRHSRRTTMSLAVCGALVATLAPSAAAEDAKQPAYSPTGVRMAGAAKAACRTYPTTRDINVTRRMYEIGQNRKISAKVMLAMFEAGWVESWLNNLNCGDADSIGIFQMRPSMGWGTYAQLQDVTYQVNKFLDVALPLQHKYSTAGQLAQAVERSAYPYRYDQALATAQKFINEAAAPYGSILTLWTSLGGVNGSLGGPLMAETDYRYAVRYVPFSNGIVFKYSSGTFPIWGDNYRHWSGTGALPKYGLPWTLPKWTPTSAAGTTGVAQAFERGWMYWSSKTGSKVIMPSMQKTFVKYGAEPKVGYPVADTVTTSTGSTQVFEKAVLTINTAGVTTMTPR